MPRVIDLDGADGLMQVNLKVEGKEQPQEFTLDLFAAHERFLDLHDKSDKAKKPLGEFLPDVVHALVDMGLPTLSCQNAYAVYLTVMREVAEVKKNASWYRASPPSTPESTPST